MSPKIRIAPSILSADFARLGEEARAMTAAVRAYVDHAFGPWALHRRGASRGLLRPRVRMGAD